MGREAGCQRARSAVGAVRAGAPRTARPLARAGWARYRIRMRAAVLAIAVSLLSLAAGAATLDQVRARGVLSCGTSQGNPGF